MKMMMNLISTIKIEPAVPITFSTTTSLLLT